MSRHSLLEIDTQALLENLELIRTFLFDHQRIIAVVKANAYGTGAALSTNLFAKHGVDFFAVACIQEAIELRQAEVLGSILVLSPFFEEEIPAYLKWNILPTLVDEARARQLDKAAFQAGKKIPFHFKMDTGMGRLGPSWEETPDILARIAELKNLKLQGLFSHFPSADLLDDFSLEQIERFKTVCKRLGEKNISVPLRHIANSSGIVAYNDPFFNAVRPGIVLYGASPSPLLSKIIFPRQTVNWKSRLLQVKTLRAGETVSYGRTFTASQAMKIGVVPVGYADGFSTLNSDKGAVVYIQDRPCPILGRVCMDYFMVDVTALHVQTGEEVLLYGDRDLIRTTDIAQRTGLIPYEILTNISPITHRRFLPSSTASKKPDLNKT